MALFVRSSVERRRSSAAPVPLLPVVTFCGGRLLLLDRPGRQPLPAGRHAGRLLRPRRDARPAGRGSRAAERAARDVAADRRRRCLPSRARAGRTSCVILTESVRADAMCSDPPPACSAPFLDDVAPDRAPLGKLTSQTPNTFSACMVLWTGLSPDVDFRTAHSAPVLWEIARAVGYRTAYVTSQNPNYEDFGTFTRRAGIDVLVTATDLGGVAQEQLGAPGRARDGGDAAIRPLDRRGDALLRRPAPVEHPRALPGRSGARRRSRRTRPTRSATRPRSTTTTATASPSRSAPSLTFVRAVRALPGWDHTAVLFLSDHGEQFREHGGLYHNHSLFDEELRVPGWIVAGASAIDRSQRAALRSHAGRRTYMQDVHETVVDLLGVEDARATLAFAAAVTGPIAPARPTRRARARSCSWPRRPASGSPTTRASVPPPESARSSERPARGPASTPPAIRGSALRFPGPPATTCAPPWRRVRGGLRSAKCR